jgi:hypothetical protein
MHLAMATLMLLLVAPLTAIADSIDNVVMTPTPPVGSTTDFTIATDFTANVVVSGFTTQVTRTPRQQLIDYTTGRRNCGESSAWYFYLSGKAPH